MGGKKVIAGCFCMQPFPLLLLCVAQDTWMFFLSALLYGWQNIGHGASMALDPVLGGLLWTQTGSSTGVLVLSFVAS